MGRKPASSLFRRFCGSIAAILGVASQSRSTRYPRRIRQKRQQTRNTKANQHLTFHNNNNNLRTETLESDVDPRRLLCILVENQETLDRIRRLLSTHALSLNRSRVIDMHELMQLVQTSKTHEDESTMTTCDRTKSCASLSTQSENVRRLKALEFIRIFIEKSKEDFFENLLDEQHLCQQKTTTIYRMIKQLLKDIHRAERQHEK